MTNMSNGDTEDGQTGNGSTFTLGSGSDVTLDEPDTSCCGKTKRFFKVTYKILRSLVGMVIILIAYSFLGAYIFMKIESEHETTYKNNITTSRDQMLTEALNLSRNIQSEAEWQTAMKDLLINYEDAVRDAKDNDVTSPSDTLVWDFWNSLFYVGTIYTTIGYCINSPYTDIGRLVTIVYASIGIPLALLAFVQLGYGNISPSTDIGRLLTIVYACIGIPLALLVFAQLGKRITIGLKVIWAFVRRWWYIKVRKTSQHKYGVTADDINTAETGSKTPDGGRSRSGSRVLYGYEIDEEFNLPILVAVIILVVYVLLGSVMYSRWEEWDAITAVYFVFISLSTIGFGDILPAHPKFFMISFIYIFIGLSLVSMVINVAIEFFSETVVRAKAKMESAKEKLGQATDKVKTKVKQAGNTAKDKVTELKENIKDETAKIINIKDEKFKKRSSSRSRSNTPVSFQESPSKERSPVKSAKEDSNG